ncbi:hypothetical protein GCM10027285_10650 [Oleiagrimonas citrea]
MHERSAARAVCGAAKARVARSKVGIIQLRMSPLSLRMVESSILALEDERAGNARRMHDAASMPARIGLE